MIHHVVIFCLFVLLFFIIVGFFISLLFESVREVIFGKQYLVFLMGIGVCLLLVLLLNRFEIVQGTELIFVFGILLGIGLTILFKAKKEAKSDIEKP